MKPFLRQIAIFFIPILLLMLIIIGSFMTYDPFMVVKDYDHFYDNGVDINMDYLVTERYLKEKELQQFDSFIFGSSRAASGYSTTSWRKEIQATTEPYSFTAFNETIFGIIGKLKLINEEQGVLKNVLLVFDTDVTFRTYRNSNGHIYIKHPRVSGESYSSFVIVNLKDYIFSGFFVPYIDYRLFKKRRKYMQDFFQVADEGQEQKEIGKLDPLLKDSIFQMKTEDSHYDSSDFYERDTFQITSEKIIKTKGVEFLKEIKQIFEKHNTEYKIVISPLYDQKKLHISDRSILSEIFGKEHVFDYSGKNYFTNNKYNYYETSHYRSVVGDSIIKEIYSKK